MGTQPVTVEHLATFAATFRDLADPGIYAGCLEVTDCSSTPPPLRIAFLTSACDSPGSRTRTYLHIGRYRAPPVPDPMVAAIAELAGRNVLHLVNTLTAPPRSPASRLEVYWAGPPHGTRLRHGAPAGCLPVGTSPTSAAAWTRTSSKAARPDPPPHPRVAIPTPCTSGNGSCDEASTHERLRRGGIGRRQSPGMTA